MSQIKFYLGPIGTGKKGNGRDVDTAATWCHGPANSQATSATIVRDATVANTHTYTRSFTIREPHTN